LQGTPPPLLELKDQEQCLIPVTFAPALRAVIAVLPNPHATSKTESTGLTLTSLTSLAETGEITLPILL